MSKQTDTMLSQQNLSIISAYQPRPLLSRINLPPGTKSVLVKAITAGSPGTGAIPKVPRGFTFIPAQPAHKENGVRPTCNLIRGHTSTSLTAVSPKTYYATRKAFLSAPYPLRSARKKSIVTGPAVTVLRRSKRRDAGDYSSPILHPVRDEPGKREEENRVKIARAKRLQERRMDENEQRVKELETAKRQINGMWEIPQIAHFLALTRTVLNIDVVPLLEFELMFIMPQTSFLLSTLMTNLLSTPLSRLHMDKSQPKSYDLWNRILSERMTKWYLRYRTERFDSISVLKALGIEPPFWDIMGVSNPLEGKQFHEMTLHQRVWIFKTVCDVIWRTDKEIREALSGAKGRDAMEVYLGVDRHNFRYFHLPAITGNDVRVYRQKDFDLRKDPYWRPICNQREQEEREQLRIEYERRQKKEAEEKAVKKPQPPKQDMRQRLLGIRISSETWKRSAIPIIEISDDESSLDDESKEEKNSNVDEDESNLDENEDKSLPSDSQDVKYGITTAEEVTTAPVSDILKDPHEFELVIDSIGALKEWIASLGGERVPEGEKAEEARKAIVKSVPCEIQLRKQLKALLEEKQPFAFRQLRIHEKIMEKLWREYDSHVNE